jgi:hypothetical protein
MAAFAQEWSVVIDEPGGERGGHAFERHATTG